MSGWGIVWSILGIIALLAFVEAIIKGGRHRPLSHMRPEKSETLDTLPDELGTEAIDKEKFNAIIARNRAQSGTLFNMRRNRVTRSLQRRIGPDPTLNDENDRTQK
jgi:hypothetical protein